MTEKENTEAIANTIGDAFDAILESKYEVVVIQGYFMPVCEETPYKCKGMNLYYSEKLELFTTKPTDEIVGLCESDIITGAKLNETRTYKLPPGRYVQTSLKSPVLNA